MARQKLVIELTWTEHKALLTACGFIEAGGGIDGETPVERQARERAHEKLVAASFATTAPIRDLDQSDWERSADDDPNRVADCGCPEQVIADEGHQEGCELR